MRATLALICSAVSIGLANVAWKVGVGGIGSPYEAANAWTFVGTLFYVLGAGLYLIGLRHSALSAAYAYSALSFVVVYGLSVTALGERPAALAYVGIAMVAAGVWLVAAGSRR